VSPSVKCRSLWPVPRASWPRLMHRLSTQGLWGVMDAASAHTRCDGHRRWLRNVLWVVSPGSPRKPCHRGTPRLPFCRKSPCPQARMRQLSSADTHLQCCVVSLSTSVPAFQPAAHQEVVQGSANSSGPGTNRSMAGYRSHGV
jgi:hypothetical protein